MPAASSRQLSELPAPPPERSTAAGQAEWIDRLVESYASIPPAQEELRKQARQAFLQALQSVPADTLSPAAGHFLAVEVQPDDFACLEWHSPAAVLDYSEMLTASHLVEGGSEKAAADQVRHLLRQALEWLESRNQIEQMFQVLQLAPIAAMQYPELRRLRNRAYLYEKRRVRRVRRTIYGWLVFHLLAVLVIFPLLFVYAENGAIQREIEQATDIEANDVSYQFLSLPDGIYWSLITAGGIGYGDITPVTRLGKALAAALGAMGVITIGVIAGLILEWISPRSLD